MEQIIVGMADCRIADEPQQVLATYALGSCIGLSVYDPLAGIGGLLHFMLPDSAIDSEQARRTPYRFADTGIPLMLERIVSRGASKRRLRVVAAGGAQMMDTESVFDIGRRNYLAMRRLLWKAGILLEAEAVGGSHSRTVRLEIGTGRILLVEAGQKRELSRAYQGKGAKHGLPALDCR